MWKAHDECLVQKIIIISVIKIYDVFICSYVTLHKINLK